MLGQDFDNLPLYFHPSAQAEHFFDCTLADQRVQAGVIFHHHRHPTSHEVKRNLIDLAIFVFRFQAFLQFLMIEDRLVEQVLQPGMMVAIQVAILQHLLARIAVCVQMLFEYDLALGKGAGLVSAQHVHRPKVLDSV